MKPDPHVEALRWLRQAEEDLDAARFLLSGQRYNLACFLAQQAAEKAMKGLLHALGAEDVWGHSVAELCRDAAGFSKDFETLISQGTVLDKYYIPTRYPDSLPGGIPAEAFEKEDAERAIGVAEHIISTVKQRT
ncbi:MAG TPA: HEPN domain-containing protein [Firmicutes bacterium]|nr:HEPN domain-containing protein [Bacillota bacterium]